MDMGDIRIKHKDKDRDTYVIHWWEFQISVWRCLVPSVSLLSYCLHPILLTPFHGKLMQGFHRCQWLPPILSVEMFNAPCHGTAIHLSVLNQAGIESSDSFASVTNAPPSGVWSSSQSFNHWILLRIPQTRFRPSGFSWMPPSVLAYTTKIPVKESKRYPPNLR